MRGFGDGAPGARGVSARMKPAELPAQIPVAARPAHRGRLFRKYLLLILVLVGGALLISGAIGLYFSYQENKVALASLQREKAVAAAERIEQFVRQIEGQLRFAALPQLGAQGSEQRRNEFLKLLKLVQEVTDIAQIDGQGREQLEVSRLKPDAIGSGKDRSQDPAFRGAAPGKTWFGPVYFRKETEPYMTIAVRSGGESSPVTVADVNLKFLWDVITRIRIGRKGKAYVVDASGHLVADPDIGLVLRKTDLSQLAHVEAAFNPQDDDTFATLAKDLSGETVLAAYAPIETLGWKVFVEQPVAEVYATLNATILRTVALMLAGLLFSALAAMWLARSMVRPIRTLQEGAARIGAGRLDQTITVKTGDELQALAEQFNDMTARLRESYAGLERKVEARTAELQETLEQQTATAEILKVISSSPSDVQPVFDAIVRNAVKLCDSMFANVFRYDGELVHYVASHNVESGAARDRLTQKYPMPPDRTQISGRTVLSGSTERMQDVFEDPDYDHEFARLHGWRSMLGVPMVREGKVLGAIVVGWSAPGQVSPGYEQLLKTFADQAAIAIDNVRLFNETREALEQQTAISEILRVISSSPSDVKPVLEAVAERAARICDASDARIFLAEGDQMRHTAGFGNVPMPVKLGDTIPIERGTVAGRAILDRAPVHLEDMAAAPREEYPTGRDLQERSGFRTILAVPLMREDRALGAILLRRMEVRPFTDKQVALLKTFADQAAIAIDNVRLFNETREALERQTAIAEVLKTISRSTFELAPVLQALIENATRLCRAEKGFVFVLKDGLYHQAANYGASPEFVDFISRNPIAPGRGTLVGRVASTRQVVHLDDARADPEYAWNESLQIGGMRTMLGVPLLREGVPVGVVAIWRPEVRPFSDAEIRLVATFADQAAIAIENVRLFNETKEALERQKASAEVLEVISGSVADTQPVFDKILESCERLFAARIVGITLVGEDGAVHPGAYRGPGEREFRRAFPVPLSRESGTGTAILERRVLHYPDVQGGGDVPEYLRRGSGMTGTRASIIAPMLWEGKGIGAIIVGREVAGAFSDKEIALLKIFADQAVIAIQNVRLFHEIEEKSHQLEVANQHKSDFLANMSHELRTPLNAIIGFSEVLIERMFGELNEKQADYLKDIHDSGKHLLALINDILDLSKIEAGRMDLELSSFDLPGALANAMTLVRERAQHHGIALGLEVDPQLGAIRADERKFKQIVLNLLSNAVKFTPDGGRVDVRANLDTDKVEIAVQDTGVGIAPEDQAAVFEEFKQVGRDYTRKAEGTGLGLALTRRFVELHGGQIRLESTPGKGSTFTVTLPVRT